MTDQQHTIARRDSEEGNKPDNRRNTDLARSQAQDKHATDQSQRQIDHHHATLAGIFELMI